MKVVPVGDICDQIRGVTYAKKDASMQPKPGYSPVLRAGNIGDHGLVLDDLVYVPDSKISDRQRVAPNDVVIATSSGSIKVVGKAAQARHGFEGGFGAFCKVLRPGSEVDPLYFGHFFRTSAYRHRVSTLAAGANINNLKNEHLNNLLLPLPPRAEQKRIAKILDMADALRAKRRESLALLDELLRSTFLDMFGDPVTNPKGWEEQKFAALADGFRNGLSPSTKGVVDGEVLTLSAITRGGFDFSKRRAARFDKAASPRQMLSTDTFMICRGNGNLELVGAGAFPDRSSNSVCFPDTMIGATVDQTVLSPAYLDYLWKSRRVREQIEKGARTTNGTHKVNQKILGSLVLPVPPLESQRGFGLVAERVEEQRRLAHAHLDQLDALFASLQSRAFRGDL
ncbi:MAG: restriction endonuclease subunit S [Deltaproteobacteria bacterium]|nr:restriction endonuclease subunit S [Deltaproteobacteria bacterium]